MTCVACWLYSVQRIPFSKPVQAAQRRKNIFVEFDTYKKNWKVISKRIPHWKTKKTKKQKNKKTECIKIHDVFLAQIILCYSKLLKNIDTTFTEKYFYDSILYHKCKIT